ncbi:nitrogen regulation protein NR(II) [Cohnella suwonensis]|uniref:histidine kinase n=1 Tax=Cohnella suwonensis TaxID=696072 RepID=A0ABW0LZN7_9BACL
MWKDSLLQILIAFLPVSMFMIWYAKPERTRYASVFLSIGCFVAMLLSIRFTIANPGGYVMDLRHIPLIIGSLYGGFLSAALLLVAYAVVRLCEIKQTGALYAFIAFVIIFMPYLFSRIPVFHRSSGSRRLKIVLYLSFALIAFKEMAFLALKPSMFYSNGGIHFVTLAAFDVLFLAVILACVHFTELGMQRVLLQRQLLDVSNKYRNEMRRLQQFIDNTPLIVVFCDSTGMITHVNEMAAKMVSPLGRNDILHRNFIFFARQMNMHVEENPVTRVMRMGIRHTEVLRIGGKTFYTVTCPIKQLPVEGSDGILFIGHDITETQLLKDEVNRMERLSLVGQMAASITHEIRNPMAVIRGFVQLLNERSSPEQQSYFRIVMDELDRANAIINDFLSLAQNRIVEKEPCQLNDLLSELKPLLWADANMRGQSIDMKLSDEMDLLLMNIKEIKQLLLNLARNGMEAMNDKGVLKIETRNMRDMVQLRIEDEGVGIAPEKLERLFEPFYTTKAKGTGLGLALCLSIVERHNGKINVESTPGIGTVFIVDFCKPGRNCW